MMSPVMLPHNTSENDSENEMIIKWWGDFYRMSSNSSGALPRTNDSVILHNLKVVVLLLIGCIGAIIVGCLLFCMFYKNERILQTIPGTKEFKRRKNEPESFYPIPHLGTIRGNQAKTLSLLANPKLRGGGLGKTSKLKSASKPCIKSLYASKDALEEDDATKETKEIGNKETQENDEDKSDESSPHESDGMEEYDAPDNTFPAGGEMEARKKGKQKKQDPKRVRRLRKKNKFSTTIVTKGAAPNTEEEQHDPRTCDDDVIPPNDVTYMSRF